MAMGWDRCWFWHSMLCLEKLQMLQALFVVIPHRFTTVLIEISTHDVTSAWQESRSKLLKNWTNVFVNEKTLLLDGYFWELHWVLDWSLFLNPQGQQTLKMADSPGHEVPTFIALSVAMSELRLSQEGKVLSRLYIIFRPQTVHLLLEPFSKPRSMYRYPRHHIPVMYFAHPWPHCTAEQQIRFWVGRDLVHAAGNGWGASSIRTGAHGANGH